MGELKNMSYDIPLYGRLLIALFWLALAYGATNRGLRMSPIKSRGLYSAGAILFGSCGAVAVIFTPPVDLVAFPLAFLAVALIIASQREPRRKA